MGADLENTGFSRRCNWSVTSPRAPDFRAGQPSRSGQSRARIYGTAASCSKLRRDCANGRHRIAPSRTSAHGRVALAEDEEAVQPASAARQVRNEISEELIHWPIRLYSTIQATARGRCQRVMTNHVEVLTCHAYPTCKGVYNANDVDKTEDDFVVLGKPLWEIDVEVCAPVDGISSSH
jgi:hypothetical protein